MYNKLSASFLDQLEEAHAALQEIGADNSARSLTIEEAQQEATAFKEQIDNDLRDTHQPLGDMDLSSKECQAPCRSPRWSALPVSSSP